MQRVQELAESQKAFLINPAVGVRTRSYLFSSHSREQCPYFGPWLCVCMCVCLCSARSHQWLFQDEGRQRHQDPPGGCLVCCSCCGLHKHSHHKQVSVLKHWKALLNNHRLGLHHKHILYQLCAQRFKKHVTLKVEWFLKEHFVNMLLILDKINTTLPTKSWNTGNMHRLKNEMLVNVKGVAKHVFELWTEQG